MKKLATAAQNTHQAVHKHLKLQHHRHTGRVLHHRHTSYRGLAVIFAVTAAAMAAITMAGRAAAGSLVSVGGIVAVPAPAAGAVISSPTDGAVLDSASTLVVGSCPPASPQLTIAVMLDGSLAGSTVCDSANDFALPVKLAAGPHSLVAQTYTVTGNQAPDSMVANVTYQPKQTSTAATASGPTIKPTEPFTLLQPDRTAVWSGTITGDTGPYNVIIDWGDGQRTNQTAAVGDQEFSHQYRNDSPHNIVLAVADGSRHSTQLPYAVASFATLNAAAPATATAQSSLPGAGTVVGLYGLFLTVLAVSGIVWLEARHAAKLDVAAVGVAHA